MQTLAQSVGGFVDSQLFGVLLGAAIPGIGWVISQLFSSRRERKARLRERATRLRTEYARFFTRRYQYYKAAYNIRGMSTIHANLVAKGAWEDVGVRRKFAEEYEHLEKQRVTAVDDFHASWYRIMFLETNSRRLANAKTLYLSTSDAAEGTDSTPLGETSTGAVAMEDAHYVIVSDIRNSLAAEEGEFNMMDLNISLLDLDGDLDNRLKHILSSRGAASVPHTQEA